MYIDAYFEACRAIEEDDENNSSSDCKNERDDNGMTVIQCKSEETEE
jgi:hypothetical protein